MYFYIGGIIRLCLSSVEFTRSPETTVRTRLVQIRTQPFDTKYGWGRVINFPVYRERAEIIPNH